MVLGLVIVHGAGLSASEKPAKNSQRKLLSCSQEAQKEKELKPAMYYDSPCGAGLTMYVSDYRRARGSRDISPSPWTPDHFPH